MGFPSGADVKLGGYEFQIDRSVETNFTHHYRHSITDMQAPQTDISGEPGKHALDNDSLYWAFDDWAGGEGNRVYYQDDNDIYDVGYELNPRIRGQITGRPTRIRATTTARDIDKRTLMTLGQGAVWLAGGLNLAYTTNNPATWTDKATSGTAGVDYTGLRSLSTSYTITAIVGDNDYVYYSAWHSGSSGSRVTLRAIKSDAAVPVTVDSEATSKPPYAGLAISHSKLFGWTGRKLYEFDIDQSMPLSGPHIRKVYDTRIDPASTNVFNSDWWADAIATENSVVMFYANDGHSEVYEYKKGVGRPIWRPPFGFTIKAAVYENGVVYFSGHWGGDSQTDGWGAIYALPLDSYRPIFLKFPRKLQGSNLRLQGMAGSYGSQILLTAKGKGRVFIYDAEADGLSMLDDLERASGSDPDGLQFDSAQHRISGCVTWGGYRYVAIHKPGGSGTGSYQVVVYSDDEPAQRETGLNLTSYTGAQCTWESPNWDYDYPMEQKDLIGFHVVFEPLVSGQFIDVSYSLDPATSSPSYTALAQITSSTSGASTGRVFIPVATSSSQKKFMRLRYKMKLTSSTAVKTPIIYSIVAEAKLVRKREEWEMIIRAKDQNARTRPLDRNDKGQTIRDWLVTMAKAGSILEFQDGYRKKARSDHTTHTVVIKELEDIILENNEGWARVRLVATTEAT